MARRRPTPSSTRALVRELRARGKSIRQIVADAAQLGHVVTRSAVGRLVGPKPAPRARRASPLPAAKVARAAVKLTRGPDGAEDIVAALGALDLARAALAARLAPAVE